MRYIYDSSSKSGYTADLRSEPEHMWNTGYVSSYIDGHIEDCVSTLLDEQFKYCSGNKMIHNTLHVSYDSDDIHDMISSAERAQTINSYLGLLSKWTFSVALVVFIIDFNWGTLLALLLSLVLLVLSPKAGLMKLHIPVNKRYEEILEYRYKLFGQISDSSKVWSIKQICNSDRPECTSNSRILVKREKCSFYAGTPYPFISDTDTTLFTAEIKHERIIFLPDIILIVKTDSIYVERYENVSITYRKIKYAEHERVYEGTKTLGNTWRYCIKGNFPRMDVKWNTELKVCEYGVLIMRSNNGFHTVLMFSNPK